MRNLRRMVCLAVTAAMVCAAWPVGFVYGAEAAESPKYESYTTSMKTVKLKGKIKAMSLSNYGKARDTGYDVLQGAATDGTYNYYAMYSKKTQISKILKLNAKTHKRVKLSRALPIDHGNDIPWDPVGKRLLVLHSYVTPWRISFVDRKSLKVTGYLDIKPSQLKKTDFYKEANKATRKEIREIAGYTGITYNKTQKKYVLRISKTGNWLILNQKLEPIAYKKVKQFSELNQGIDSNSKYVFVSESKAGEHNIVAVFDWEGNYLYKVTVPSKYEIECIYHNSHGTYVGFYYSWNKRNWIRTKTVKVKWKKVDGKWVYKKKKIKLPKYSLMHDNYIVKVKVKAVIEN